MFNNTPLSPKAWSILLDYDYRINMGVCVSRMRAMRQGSVGVVVCVVVL